MNTLIRLRNLLARQFKTTSDQIAADDTVERLTARYIGPPGRFSKFGGSLLSEMSALCAMDMEDEFAEQGFTVLRNVDNDEEDENWDFLTDPDRTVAQIAAFIDSKISVRLERGNS